MGDATPDDDALVETTIDGGIATLTVNRPDVLNCASLETLDQLLRRLHSVEGRPDVDVVVLTGAGNEAFSAGFDLKEIPIHDGQQAVHEHFRQAALYWHEVIPAIARIKLPVLSAVNGIAVGGGMGMALASDMAFATPDATFTPAFVPLGSGPNSGTTYHLPRILGLRKAIEWIWTNETIDAETAADWNIVNRVVHEDSVLDATLDVARQLTEGPSAVFAWSKLNMHRSFAENMETQLEWEKQCVIDTIHTEDFWESTKSFIEEGEGNIASIDLPGTGS